MNKIMVSLVSEQTIPNVLAVIHFQPSELLFISTAEMERKEKVTATLNAINRRSVITYSTDNNVAVIRVREDSILDCHRELDRWIENRDDAEFIVNLTGGTKMMSIAAYEFFKDFGSKMIYIPLKNEYVMPFPKKTPRKPTALDVRLSVLDYLTAYGLNIKDENRLEKKGCEADKRKSLAEWIANNYVHIVDLLRCINNHLRSARKRDKHLLSMNYVCRNDNERELLARLEFAERLGNHSRQLNKSEIGFLTGGWLEEFCFNTVHELKGHGVDDVVIGVPIKSSQGTDNEFDVMFTSENTLYFIECKSLYQEHDQDTDVLYKLGALQRDFGLRVESFLVTTSPYILNEAGNIKVHILARAEQFKTEVVIPSQVIHFKSILAGKLGLPIVSKQDTPVENGQKGQA